MRPTIGRIVKYILTAQDADQINRRRVAKPHEPSWVAGAQAHVGAQVTEYQTFPCIVVVEVEDGSIQGQVFLEGNDVLWVQAIKEGSAPGTWHWPERV